MLQGTPEGDTLPARKRDLSAMLQEQLPGGLSKLPPRGSHADMCAFIEHIYRTTVVRLSVMIESLVLQDVLKCADAVAAYAACAQRAVAMASS